MKNVTVTIVLFLFCVLAFQSSYAGNYKRIGTAGAQELLIPVGAKSIALNGANVASVSGVDAMFWNPAGLSRANEGTEVLFSQMSYIADIGVSYGAVNVNAGDIGYFGASIKSLSFGNIIRTTEDFPDGTGELFSPTFAVFGVSYSRMLNDRISVGLVFNLISEKIMSVSSTGFGVNAGVIYHGLAIPELSLGIVIKNIGPNMSYDGSNLYKTATVLDAGRPAQYYKIETASFELPTTMEIGLTYENTINELNKVSVSGNFQNNNYFEDEFKVSAEYGYDNLLFLRGGYITAPKYDSESYLYDYTLGFGVNLDLQGIGVKFDYAYRHIKSNFDANNVFSISLVF